VLVVDDASSDDTVKIAKQFEERDKRVRVVVNDKTLGQFGNRNRAALLASYSYIKFFDSDDIMYSHCLEVFAKAIEKYPEAGLYSELKLDNSSHLLPRYFTPYQAYINHYWRGSTLLYIGPSGTLYNKTIFFQLKGIDETIGILADTHLSLKLAAVAPVVGVARDTFYWRVHSEQVTEGQKNYDRMLKERFLIDQLILHGEDCPLEGKKLELTVAAVKKRFGRNIIKLSLKYGNVKSLFELMNSSNYTFKDLLLSGVPNFKRLSY
jgi:glycosyltransferase involved in cell wall biosynthesis